MMTDPIADLLTRIRNAQLAKHDKVTVKTPVSADLDTHSGTLFTVYCDSNPTQVSLSNVELYKNITALSTADMKSKQDTLPTRSEMYYFKVGDLNADDNVNLTDAQLLANSVGIAINNHWNSNGEPKVIDSSYNAHLSALLPGVSLQNSTTHLVVNAGSADGDFSGFVVCNADDPDNSDAHQLLQYYVDTFMGLNYSSPTNHPYVWGTTYQYGVL
jgi:hypothetical protein